VFRSGEYSVEFTVDDVSLVAASPRHFNIGDEVSFHIAPEAVRSVGT
jgi:hypothetical protein